MNNTALGAESIIFISEAHEKFYYEKLKEVWYQSRTVFILQSSEIAD